MTRRQRLCDACEHPLTLLYADVNDQYDNALIIQFIGGYGMFVDLFGDREDDGDTVICHKCAHELCDKVPWIGKLLTPHDSHSHRTVDIPQLLEEGHTGWDLEEYERTQATIPQP